MRRMIYLRKAEKAKQLFVHGLPFNEIAMRHGVKTPTLRYWARKDGWHKLRALACAAAGKAKAIKPCSLIKDVPDPTTDAEFTKAMLIELDNRYKMYRSWIKHEAVKRNDPKTSEAALTATRIATHGAGRHLADFVTTLMDDYKTAEIIQDEEADHCLQEY